MKSRSNHPIKSGTVIARLLGMEGFTEHVGNLVKSYAKFISNDRIKRRFEVSQNAFKQFMKDPKITDSDRIIVGKFISHMEKSGFEAGLRIGLITKVYELEEKNV